jgi:hypothetical protein
MKNNNIVTLFSILPQIKILHFQTTSFTEHEILGELYEDFDGKIDELIELMLQHAYFPVGTELETKVMYWTSKEGTIAYLTNLQKTLETMELTVSTDEGSKLQEMVSSIKRTLYLLNKNP